MFYTSTASVDTEYTAHPIRQCR